MAYNDNYGSGPGGGNFIWVVLLIGAAIVYLGFSGGLGLSPPIDSISSQSINSLPALSPDQENYSRMNEEMLTDSDHDGLIDRDDLCPETPSSQDIDSEGCSITQVNPITINACGKVAFGMPDFAGTNDEGKGCNDFIVQERDLKCVANPPLNYDGTIMGASSSPTISCCFTDGSCNWIQK